MLIVPELVPFDLTYVLYHPSFVGLCFAAITLSPFVILICYFTLILSNRNMLVLYTLIGQFVNEILNIVLKKSFKQARPELYLGQGYGMPSSHAQFMAYVAVNAVYILQLYALLLFFIDTIKKHYLLNGCKLLLLCFHWLFHSPEYG